MVRTRAAVAVVYTGDDGCCEGGVGVYFQGWVYARMYVCICVYMYDKACVRARRLV